MKAMKKKRSTAMLSIGLALLAASIYTAGSSSVATASETSSTGSSGSSGSSGSDGSGSCTEQGCNNGGSWVGCWYDGFHHQPYTCIKSICEYPYVQQCNNYFWSNCQTCK